MYHHTGEVEDFIINLHQCQVRVEERILDLVVFLVWEGVVDIVEVLVEEQVAMAVVVEAMVAAVEVIKNLRSI
jgi:hypothetical protein